jgi:hypothetical protein
MAALARPGLTMSRMAVGSKSAEEGLILLFLRCNSTLHKPATDDRVIKNTQQLAIQEGATATMAAIPMEEGRRRQGTWQSRATMRWRKGTIGELTIVALMLPMQGLRKQRKGS